MTKDGRPSRIKDIRLFGSGFEGWEGAREAEAFARRLCWWLNSEGFGIGHDPALYVDFNPELPAGEIVAQPPKFTPDNWWFREVAIGVPDGFPGADAASRVPQGVAACLKALKPEDAELIDEAARIVSEHGDACRFLLKVKETAKELTEVSTTIGVWPGPSLLFAGLTDKTTGAYREAPPAELGFYDDGVALAGKVKIVRRGVELESRTSVPARMVAE
nr:hypothetical protein [Actinomycetales bacterium]